MLPCNFLKTKLKACIFKKSWPVCKLPCLLLCSMAMEKNWAHSTCRHVEPVSLACRKCGFKPFPWFLDPGMVFCNSRYRSAQQCSLCASASLCEVYPVDLFQDFSKKMMIAMRLHG